MANVTIDTKYSERVAQAHSLLDSVKDEFIDGKLDDLADEVRELREERQGLDPNLVRHADRLDEIEEKIGEIEDEASDWNELRDEIDRLFEAIDDLPTTYA